MSTYNTTFFQDFSQPTNRRDQGYQGYQGYPGAYMQSGFQGPQFPSGNGWHQRMGYQKPSNLDQAIHHIRSSEYAPFTREAEQPSIASLYLQQQYGGLGRMQQEQDYGMEDAPPKEDRLMPYRRTSNSPERGGVRRAGPEWGNTQFGTKPRRRSIVETEARQVYDDNAPPLQSFYDDMIAEEQRRLKIENVSSVTTQPALNGPTSANANAIVLRRPLFDNPKAIRVSNYAEHRWPEVLLTLAQFGNILERFEELRRKPDYEPIPPKVLMESEDEVVRSARMFFTGEGWTKITFACGEAADKLVAQSEKITVGGRTLTIEQWKPDVHGRPQPDGFSIDRTNNAVGRDGLGASTMVDVNMPGALPRKRTEPQSIFDDPFATPRPSKAPTEVVEPQMPLSTPGGSMLSTKMKGAKLVTLQDGSDIFKEKPGWVARVFAKMWGEVGLHGWGEQVKSNGWGTWFIELLFGKL